MNASGSIWSKCSSREHWQTSHSTSTQEHTGSDRQASLAKTQLVTWIGLSRWLCQGCTIVYVQCDRQLVTIFQQLLQEYCYYCWEVYTVITSCSNLLQVVTWNFGFPGRHLRPSTGCACSGGWNWTVLLQAWSASVLPTRTFIKTLSWVGLFGLLIGLP